MANQKLDLITNIKGLNSIRTFLILLLFYGCNAFANDGAFYMNGNHLIPIVESEISVKKEVLTIKRIANDYLQITVSYIFNNPNEAKNILVGFEAPSPSGDVNGTPIDGKHPYISNFSVKLNGVNLAYKTALVTDKEYYKGGKIISKSVEEAMGEYFSENDADFYYVYHFNAAFKKGLNTIVHTYNFKLSSSVMEMYSFGYILTAANRWANNGIDDFTLIIDLGDFQYYEILRSFFTQNSDWMLDGKVIGNGNTPKVYVNHGAIIYTKKNFHPKGELFISAPYRLELFEIKEFDSKIHQLPFRINEGLHILKSVNSNSHKILRNLPYARRGYIFKTSFIQAYYKTQNWYTPNPSYVSNLSDLTKEEKMWLQKLN